LASRPLWGLWRALTALYPLSQSLLAMVTHRGALNRETSYFWFDVVIALRAMPSSLKVATRLDEVSDAELDGVIAIAELNSKRQEHFLRSIVLGYLTVPLTVGAIAAELWPGALLSLFQRPELSGVWSGTIAGLATALLIRFVADWRARSFLTLLQMVRLERQSHSRA
jgi:hypothetical protein